MHMNMLNMNLQCPLHSQSSDLLVSTLTPPSPPPVSPQRERLTMTLEDALLTGPNTALLLLMFATFAIAQYFRLFRNSKLLGRRVRRMLGEFGVPAAILVIC